MATNNPSNNNDPGNIGQQYEHRKSHKIGVLESRNTKFKTLMFRDKDGGSFNVSYSTFRSDWRKYTGDEVIAQTSTQVDKDKKADKAEKKPVEKKAPAEKKAKVTLDREALDKAVNECYNLVTTALSKLNKENAVKIGGRGGRMNCVRVKNGKKNIFEIWIFDKTFEFFTNKEQWQSIQWADRFKDDVPKPEIHENFNLKYKAVFDIRALDAVVKLATKAV